MNSIIELKGTFIISITGMEDHSKYQCPYCLTLTFDRFENAIHHCQDVHTEQQLRINRFGLNEYNGKFGYFTLNFNIIPKRVHDDGKRIVVDSTPNALTDSIKLIDAVSSPNNKLPRTSISTHAAESSMQADLSTSNDLDYIITLIPTVIENLRTHGKLDGYMKFHKLLAEDKFPVTNIAFLLFLDVVKWFDCENSLSMRYDPAVTKFWRIGYKLFHGKWLRFMGGPKYNGAVVNASENSPKEIGFDPATSRINFAVPLHKVQDLSEAPLRPSDIQPGMLDHILDAFTAQSSAEQTFKLCFDGKKINSSLDASSGDIDLFGFEGPPTLKEKREHVKRQVGMVDDIIKSLQEETVKNKCRLDEISSDKMEIIVSKLQSIIGVISNVIKELRECLVSKVLALSKFKKLASPDWRRSKLVYVISSIETSKYDLESTTCTSHETR